VVTELLTFCMQMKKNKKWTKEEGRLPAMRERGCCLWWLVGAAAAAGNSSDSSSKRGGYAVRTCCAGRWFFSSWECDFFFLLCLYSSCFSLSLLFSFLSFRSLFLSSLFLFPSFPSPSSHLCSPLFPSLYLPISSVLLSISLPNTPLFWFLYLFILPSTPPCSVGFPLLSVSVSIVLFFFSPVLLCPPFLSKTFPDTLSFSSFSNPPLFSLSPLSVLVFPPPLSSVHPLARGCRRFHLLLQGQSNGRRAWWRVISAVRHASLIEANQRLRCCIVSRPAAHNVFWRKQCSVKRHRFATLNDISDLVLGCFCNFVIKPRINYNWIPWY